MRHLNRKQKKMLDEWYEKHSDLPGLGVFHLEDCEEFTCEFLEELRDVNDFEILCSCINRYVSDIEMEENNKTKTIRACWELVEKYRNPKGKRFYGISNCPLCKIHKNENGNCGGCPLANTIAGVGCVLFKSHQKATRVNGKDFDTHRPSPADDLEYRFLNNSHPAFIKRAEFHERIIPILRKIPPERFTKAGWTYFNEIKRNW